VKSEYDWAAEGNRYKSRAKAELRACLHEEILGEKKAKCKEILMALLSKATISVRTDLRPSEVHAYQSRSPVEN